MKYLIDGYNLLFHLFHTNEKLEIQRNLVIEFINENAKYINGKIYIIFDAHKNINDISTKRYFNNLTIIYTPQDQTADEYIIERLNLSKNPSNKTVITSDKPLRLDCIGLKTNVKSIDEFIDFLDHKKKKVKEKKLFDFEENCEDTKHEIDRLLKIFEENYKNLN
jgi:predicted RNA-binding protein with PIN domain